MYEHLRLSTASRVLNTLAQVLVLSAIWFVADRAASLFKVPLSGGVLGLFTLVILLLTNVVRPAYIEKGAELLLANMLLYFIPLVVSIIQFTRLFESSGIKLIVAISVGFAVVLVVTAVTVEWFCQWTRKRRLHAHLLTRKQRLTTRQPRRVI